jgi:copper resistance protein D
LTALALCRFAHFLAAMLTFGMSEYLWVYAPRRLRLALTPTVRRLALVMSLVALISAIVWLQLEAASMAGDWSAAFDPKTIGAVLADTEFGHVWAAHLVLATALVAVVLFERLAVRSNHQAFHDSLISRASREKPASTFSQRAPGPREQWGATSLASGALLASLGLVDHAAMQTGAEGVLHRANDAVHLLSAGAWIGGLVPFAMCLRAYETDELRKDAVQAMTRFSFWGQFIVAAIVLTGVVNIALTSGHPPIPPTTPYRALLVAKLFIVAVMISLALFNRLILAPRLNASATALAALRATSTAEIALGCVVVALVSVFGLLDPA